MFYFDQFKWCIYYDNTNCSNIEGKNVHLWVNLIGNKYEFRKLNVMFYFSTLWQALDTHSSGLFLNSFYLPAWVLCCCSSVFLRALDGSPSWPLSFQPHTYRSPPSGDQTVWVISPSSSCRQQATTRLPESCLVWKSLAANADRVPASCCHAAHGHPPEGLHSPGLLLGGEASMTQLTMTGGVSTVKTWPHSSDLHHGQCLCLFSLPAQSPGVHRSRGTEQHGVLATQCKTLGFQMWR